MFTMTPSLKTTLYDHFKSQKLELSYAISKPFPFFEGLRDKTFISERMYTESLEAYRNMVPISKVVYNILSTLEDQLSPALLSVLFSQINLREYPNLVKILKSFKNVVYICGGWDRTIPVPFEALPGAAQRRPRHLLSLLPAPQQPPLRRLTPVPSASEPRTVSQHHAKALSEPSDLTGPAKSPSRVPQKGGVTPVNLPSHITDEEDSQQIPSTSPVAERVSRDELTPCTKGNEDTQEMLRAPSVHMSVIRDDSPEPNNPKEPGKAPSTPATKKGKKRKSAWLASKKRKQKRSLPRGITSPGHRIQEKLQVVDRVTQREDDSTRNSELMKGAQKAKTECAQTSESEEVSDNNSEKNEAKGPQDPPSTPARITHDPQNNRSKLSAQKSPGEKRKWKQPVCSPLRGLDVTPSGCGDKAMILALAHEFMGCVLLLSQNIEDPPCSSGNAVPDGGRGQRGQCKRPDSVGLNTTAVGSAAPQSLGPAEDSRWEDRNKLIHKVMTSQAYRSIFIAIKGLFFSVLEKMRKKCSRSRSKPRQEKGLQKGTASAGHRIQEKLQVVDQVTQKEDDSTRNSKIMTRAQKAKLACAGTSGPAAKERKNDVCSNSTRTLQKNIPQKGIGENPNPSKAKRVLASERSDDDTVDFQSPTLPVTCGVARGILYKEKMKNGASEKCIQNEEGLWFTPREFQVKGGIKSNDWKRSVRCRGKSLQQLFEKGLLICPPRINLKREVDCPAQDSRSRWAAVTEPYLFLKSGTPGHGGSCSEASPVMREMNTTPKSKELFTMAERLVLRMEKHSPVYAFLQRKASDECEVCCRGGRLLCCDTCLRAFHEDCHIPPAEAERSPWSCTFCRIRDSARSQQCLRESEVLARPMGPAEQLKCEFILLKVYCHPQSAFFAKIPSNLQDYAEPFKEAMWLDLVKERLTEKVYTVDWFVRDIRLIFHNHKAFHKASDLSHVGLDLEAEFEKHLKEMLIFHEANENSFQVPL
ncbi:LOW QUALITY PROTEIN: sp110 nuclear body protein [Rhynchonycteris naso]